MFRIRIRIESARLDTDPGGKKCHVLKCCTFSFESRRLLLCCSRDLGIRKLQFLKKKIKKFFVPFLVIKTLDLDPYPDLDTYLYPDPH